MSNDGLRFCFIVDTALVGGLGWSALCGDQTGLHSSPPASVSQTLGLQAHTTTPGIGSIFFASRIPIYLNDHTEWCSAAQHYPVLLSPLPISSLSANLDTTLLTGQTYNKNGNKEALLCYNCVSTPVI